MIQMHEGLLTLLKEFDAICKKHGITYYLEGGSLLGAVRHKGFLPWDDDVDLTITRDNFQKLLCVIDQELPANRELYCYERYPDYLRDTVKYTNLDTTVLFPNHILDGHAAGQHIDLFILDPVPSDPAQQAQYQKYATIYSELMTPVYVLCDDIVSYLDEYNQYLRMMQEQGRDQVLNILREKLFTMEDSDACDTYLLRWGNRHIFYPKAFFGTPVYLQFEDAFFPAPQQYHRFLRTQFGDSWMIIPDVSHQEDHNTYDNYRVPCKTFIADYSPYIDYQQFREDYSIRKQYRLELLKAGLPLKEAKTKQTYVFLEMLLENLTRELSPQARELLAQERYGELAAYYEPYYNAQLSPDLLSSGLAMTVDEAVLHASALALAMSGRFGQAEKLIKVNNCDAASMKELMELITDVRECMLASEEGRYSDAKLLVCKWITRYPLQLNIGAFLIRQGIREEQDTSELMHKLESLLAHYPQSDELMLLKGHLLAKQGKHDEAEIWYRRCKEITRNGLILMELSQLSAGEDTQEPDEASEEKG